MEFEWDEVKDAANKAKHGVSLGDVVRLDWDNGQTRPDNRFAYGEARTEILGVIAGRLYLCIFTMREGVYRIISLRKANIREEGRYEQSRPK